jgi:uncharacterized membrane protein YtjA (UPF0391 family)
MYFVFAGHSGKSAGAAEHLFGIFHQPDEQS